MRALSRRLICLASLSLSISGCKDDKLFTAPQLGGVNSPPPLTDESNIILSASVPYTTIKTIVDSKIPQSHSLGGSGVAACAQIPYVDGGSPWPPRAPSIRTRSECANYNWNANIAKNGNVTVSRMGNDLSIAQAINIRGQAGLGGALAGILSLSGKNIDVAITPHFSLAATLDSNWCPVTPVTPLGRWVNSASVEIVGRNCVGFNLGPLGHPEVCAGPVNIDIGDMLNAEIEKKKVDLTNASRNAISCDAVRPKIAEHWNNYVIPLQKVGSQDLYLNIEPQGAAFSGVIAEEERLRVSVRVDAKTTVSATAVPVVPIPLPPLKPMVVSPGGLNLSVPIVANYNVLKDVIAENLKDKSFDSDIAGRKATVKITDINIYPSNNSVAIGLKIDAKLPANWFNTSGWVYLTGKPVVLPGGKSFKIDDIRFSTVLDNQFWSAVQAIFQGEILAALNAKSIVDLSAEIAKASASTASAVAKANVPGLKITAGEPKLELKDLIVGQDALFAVTKASLAVEAEITSDIIK